MRRTVFTLVVDDFCVNYKYDADAEHFLATLWLCHIITVDMTGSKHLGFIFKWNDSAKSISLSLPIYILKVLKRFHPGEIPHGAASPAVYTPPQYGAHIQHASRCSRGVTVQEIVGCMLFYARAVDSSMLTAVNHISSDQAKPTRRVMAAAEHLLQYSVA